MHDWIYSDWKIIERPTPNRSFSWFIINFEFICDHKPPKAHRDLMFSPMTEWLDEEGNLRGNFLQNDSYPIRSYFFSYRDDAITFKILWS